ncbi:DNA excision repair protein ERCC-6-like [Archocentrus centrarchus]|uniref:DNA excision repair protein ERCC-6-like n=1 Tax=Archocentrus centrarchus TaxID=63155 RepID=UPI0011E9DCF2|nr:DNA excision repair protein ERCC-6-like [Archocentrus centrarchus]
MDGVHGDAEMAAISAKLEKSLSINTDDKMETYHRFIQDGKNVARQGELHKALEFFKLAYSIHQSQKLESRIKKIEELIAENDLEEEDDEFVNVNNSGLMLFKDLYDKLFDYQRDGVAFLYSLYRDGRKGGILADDMGLGKTIQVISFLSGMYDSELAKHTLLVMPTSLITNWTKEFSKWTPGMRVKEFHGISKGERTRNLERVQRRGGVIITTYTMLLNNWQQLAMYNGKEFTWDYMILDEAHKIKSTATKTAKSAYAIPSKNRVLLTGTPVQNNLREMWALFDFACKGTLLGTAKTFKAEYENPITRAREKDATPGEKALGSRMSENLMAIIKPYFLRRTKSEVQKNKTNGTQSCKEEHSGSKNDQVLNHEADAGAVMPKLTRKNDLIVWTYLSAVQEDIYRKFISLDHIRELLLTTKSPLAELNILKKLCDHPRLLSGAAIAKLGLEESAAESQESEEAEANAHSIANVSDDILISESGKLVFLFSLLERLRQEGHRTLVFAHYRKVLDIIERILGNRGFKVLRLDGTITQIAERERLISLFQTDKRYSVFLLTTQVGGVGITLTAANRVVIYDPSWNPATDAQAVDRAYRIGQTANVIIYRLITCGTVEEKIYRRQVFKDSLIRQNTGDKKNPFRYFSKQELKELFTLEDTHSSSTQLQLQALHSRHRRTDPELDEHIAHLHAMEMFGISDHDLMFSLDVNHDEALENKEEHHYIEGRVQKAQELMKAESELQMQLAESMVSSTEPAWLRYPKENNSREQSHKKKPRSPKPSPSYPKPDNSLNHSLVVVDLERTGSEKEDSQETLSKGMIDLTADESTTEEMPVVEVSHNNLSKQNLDSPKDQSVKQERNFMEATDAIEESLVLSESGDIEDASIGQPVDESSTSVGAAVSVYVTASDEDEQKLTGNSPLKCHDTEMDLWPPHITPPENKRLSVLQASSLSFKANTSSRVGSGIESLNGNFNLQLEDSDSDHDVEEEHQEADAGEQKLLSQLQVEGSFDVNKSLCEWVQKEASRHSVNNGHTFNLDESDESIVATKKKKTAVIYDSEEEEENDDDQLGNSFQVCGASTPKTANSITTPFQTKKSIGGNTSVASRRSFLHSIIQDMDNQDMVEEDEGDEDAHDASEIHSDEAEEEDIICLTHDEVQDEEPSGETLNSEGEEEGEEEEEEDEDAHDVSEIHSNEAEEEDIIGLTHDEVQEEEPSGETLNSEGEEEKEGDSESGDVVDDSGEERSLEEPSSDPELASNETMDRCTADMGVKEVIEDESYDSLVLRGWECYSKAKLDDALGFFLRAIDIKPGDPEVQLMTIQLYRQLSQGARR